jgi:hypothetical protein
MSLNQRLCPVHGLGRSPGCFGCNVVAMGERDRAADFRAEVERKAIERAAVEARARELSGKTVEELARLAEGELP